jgi:hypothetical protein
MSNRIPLILLSTVLIVVVALLGTSEVLAELQDTCTDSNGTYTITNESITLHEGITTFTYSLSGKPAAIKKVTEINVVFTGIKAENIVLGPYSDVTNVYANCIGIPSTGIGKGDCEGITATIKPEPGTATELPFNIQTNVSTIGYSTFSVITGSGIDTCISPITTGIAGPGTLVNFYAPGSSTECRNLSGVASVLITRDPDRGCIEPPLEFYPGTTECDGTRVTINPGVADPTLLFSGTPDQLCPESWELHDVGTIVRVDMRSYGLPYVFCYDSQTGAYVTCP